jgi:serine/threonine protein kinase
MKVNSICLTADALRRLATNEFSPEQLQQLEAHIDQCPHCLELLQQEVSVSWLEQDVIEVLRSSDPSIASTAVDDEFPVLQSYDSILSLLGPTDDPHRIGRIDAYEVVGIVGRGGMGVVFKAFDPGLQRFVAIKMLLPHLAESGVARRRFAREAKAAAAVVDDFVLPIHGVAEWRGIPYIVSQYCRGETLQRRIENQGTLEVIEVLRISMQIAKGLAAAHAQGLVHRDVKPANILLDQGIERVQLTDFGLARAVDDASMTRTGILAGTPQFMSPEQAKGEPLDGRSDLFALGSVMYAMCTGRPPFRGTQALPILQKIAGEKHKPVQLLNPDVPRRLASLIDRLLEKRPADRIQSAEEVAKWLEAYLAYHQHPTGQSKPRLPKSKKKRTRVLAIVLAGLATIAAVVGAGTYGGWGASSNPEKSNFADFDGQRSAPSISNSSAFEPGAAVAPSISQSLREGILALKAEQHALALTFAEAAKLSEAIDRYEYQLEKIDFGPGAADPLASEIQKLQSQIEAFEKTETKW